MGSKKTKRQYVLGSGTEAGDPRKVLIDLDRLIESRLLLQANSGGGKSWALRRILEETHGAVQQIVIDVEDEFHTLREKFDYVLAGRHGGDCPADTKSAPLLARRLLELGVSAIIGIYELRARDRVLFVRRFLDSLVNAPRELWHPVLVVVDEAHIFCPQNGSAESASAVIDLMTRGRKRGFCGVLATQRISKLHKDAAAEANNKLIGRSALDVDMRRASDELGFATKNDQRRLRTLRPGHFFAFGPAISDFVIEVAVGGVQTTHPKAGQRAAPPSPPRSKIKKLLGQLADLPAEAEEEARTVEELRAEIKKLKRELRTKPEGVTHEEVRAAFEKGVSSATRDIQAKIAKAEKARARAVDKLEQLLPEIRGADAVPEGFKIDIKPTNLLPPTVARSARSRRTRSSVASATKSSALTGARQNIIDTLMLFEAMGLSMADRNQLALLGGVSPRSSGYANNLGALRTQGFIDYPAPGQVGLTDDGRAIGNAPEVEPNDASLHALIESILPRAKWRIIEALIAVYPDPLSREELAEEVGVSPSSSGYANNLGSLRTLGLVEYPIRGAVRATSILFLGN